MTSDFPTNVVPPVSPAAALGVKAGDVIGAKYEVVRLLGTGGMGAVFEARHSAIGRTVAIKVLRPELAADANVAARFLQEARASNDVRHKNIVEVVDFGSDGTRLFMVMEYLRGEPLSALIRRESPLAPARIIPLMAPVMRALAVAHDRGIVHRDIKPENVFVSEDDDGGAIPKILDFGIAKRIVAGDVRLTNTHTSFGTPAYMAPEQAMGARDVTGAADQYACAVILFEALTGSLPHPGETYNAVIIAKVNSPPKDIGEFRPDLDAGLRSTVMRALAREPNDRFASVAAFREALLPYAGLVDTGPSSLQRASGPSRASSDPMLDATIPADSARNVTPILPAKSTAPEAVAPTAQAWTTGTPREALRPRKSPLRFLGLLVPIAIAGLVVYTTKQPSQQHVTQASVQPPPTPTPATVTMHIVATPPTAEIWMDGQLLGHGTADFVTPRGAQTHTLHMAAQGYQDGNETVTAQTDERIERELIPLPAQTEPTTAPDPSQVPQTGRPATGTSRSHPRQAPANGSDQNNSRHPQMDRDIRF